MFRASRVFARYAHRRRDDGEAYERLRRMLAFDDAPPLDARPTPWPRGSSNVSHMLHRGAGSPTGNSGIEVIRSTSRSRYRVRPEGSTEPKRNRQTSRIIPIESDEDLAGAETPSPGNTQGSAAATLVGDAPDASSADSVIQLHAPSGVLSTGNAIEEAVAPEAGATLQQSEWDSNGEQFFDDPAAAPFNARAEQSSVPKGQSDFLRRFIEERPTEPDGPTIAPREPLQAGSNSEGTSANEVQTASGREPDVAPLATAAAAPDGSKASSNSLLTDRAIAHDTLATETASEQLGPSIARELGLEEHMGRQMQDLIDTVQAANHISHKREQAQAELNDQFKKRLEELQWLAQTQSALSTEITILGAKLDAQQGQAELAGRHALAVSPDQIDQLSTNLAGLSDKIDALKKRSDALQQRIDGARSTNSAKGVVYALVALLGMGLVLEGSLLVTVFRKQDRLRVAQEQLAKHHQLAARRDELMRRLSGV